MDKWDTRWLNLAASKAAWSQDPSTGVAAIVVRDHKFDIASGFNGLPGGMDDGILASLPREAKYEMMIHAEVNAVILSRQNLCGCHMYIHPMSPCGRCASVIAQTGITRVVAPRLHEDSALFRRWEPSLAIGRYVLKACGVELVLV